jgi:hypothetical protein
MPPGQPDHVVGDAEARAVFERYFVAARDEGLFDEGFLALVAQGDSGNFAS